MKVVGLAGWSGAGKTTLIARLIPAIKARGLSVSTVKHAHHAFEIDQPGKDSWRHRKAGAQEVLIASDQRFALMHELRGAPEPHLADLLRRLAPADLVIVEGFKRAAYPKVEVYRSELGKSPLWPDDPFIAAVAASGAVSTSLPVVKLDDTGAVTSLVLAIAAPLQTITG